MPTQLNPPSVDTRKASVELASCAGTLSVKVLSLLMKSPGVPVSSKPSRLSVPVVGATVSTLNSGLAVTSARVSKASLPAASRMAPPFSVRPLAAMAMPAASLSPAAMV